MSVGGRYAPQSRTSMARIHLIESCPSDVKRKQKKPTEDKCQDLGSG
jgi:hypothetical protein